MILRLCIFILLISNLQSPCEAAETKRNVGANHQTTNTACFTVEYTLIIANSPDCEPSLVDYFPVGVQYRTIIGSGDGEQSNNSVGEWMDSPGKQQICRECPRLIIFISTNAHTYVPDLLYEQKLLT